MELPNEQLLVWGAAITVALAIFVPYWVMFRRRTNLDRARKEEANLLGIDKAIGQFPYIDESKCVGCGTCVKACPEGDVLGVVGGTATVINGLRCIGHALCEEACPVGAIEVGLGDLKSRQDIPLLDDFNESSVPGVYVAGELAGMGLIRVALEQGQRTVAGLYERLDDPSTPPPAEGTYDLVIVGAGPAGIAAGLAAKERGMSCLLLDQNPDLGGSILHYPRAKLVLTQPAEIPLWGSMNQSEYSKERLLEIFSECLDRYEIETHFSSKVVNIERNGHLRLFTDVAQYDARFVVLALGRRGNPRKLGVPGEEHPKVMYRLKDADAYRDKHIVVVGGGDSAVEAAMGVARLGRNSVTLSYRKDKLVRIKKKNQDAFEKLLAKKLIQLEFGSQVRSIGPESVTLQTGDRGDVEIDNDYVFVFIGGEPPFELLHKSGIRFGGTSSE